MVKTNAHIGQGRYARESAKGKGMELANIIHKFGLTATNAIPQPKNEETQRLLTCTSANGQISKKIDYIMISNNIKNCVNYTRAE